MKILHYSNDSGSIEYVVFSDIATQDVIDLHAKPDCTLSGIYDVEQTPRGTFGRADLSALGTDRLYIREN